MEENSKVRIVTRRTEKKEFDFKKFGIGNLKVPRPEQAWMIRKSSLHLALSNSLYFKFIEKQSEVNHQEFVFGILGCVGMLSTNMDALTTISNGFLTAEKWSGAWITILIGLTVLYSAKIRKSIRIKKELLNKSAFDKLLSDIDGECEEYNEEENLLM